MLLKTIDIELEMFDCRNGYKISHPTVYGEKSLLKVPRVNYQWDGDLMDLSNIKEHNNNVTFVLVVIDVFNRYAYIRPLKSK